MSAQRFGIDARFRRLHVACAWLLIGLGLFCLAVPWLEPTRPQGTAVLWAGALFCLGLGGAGLWILRRPARFAVELDAAGVAGGEDPTAQLPWREVARIVVRPWHHRVELHDVGGRVRAALEYQLEGFEAALAQVARETAHLYPALPPPQRFRGSGGRMKVVGGAVMLGLVATLFGTAQPVLGLLVLLVFVGAALLDARNQVRSVAVEEHGLRIESLLRRRTLPWSEIAAARVALRQTGQAQLLDVALERADGRRCEFICPDGVDPFALRAAIAHRVEASRTARAAGS